MREPTSLTSKALLRDLKASVPAAARAEGAGGFALAELLRVIAPAALTALLDWLATRYDIRPRSET